MSVVKNKRGESNMEFLHTARELQIITLRKCVNFPKRYTFYLGQPIADLAIRIYLNVKMANSIYPTNAHEVQLRKDYLIKANAECYTLASQIEVAHELFGLEPKNFNSYRSLQTTSKLYNRLFITQGDDNNEFIACTQQRLNNRAC